MIFPFALPLPAGRGGALARLLMGWSCGLLFCSCRLPCRRLGAAGSLVVLIEEQGVAALLAHGPRMRHTDSCSRIDPRSAAVQRASTGGRDFCVATLLPKARGSIHLFILRFSSFVHLSLNKAPLLNLPMAQSVRRDRARRLQSEGCWAPCPPWAATG